MTGFEGEGPLPQAEYDDGALTRLKRTTVIAMALIALLGLAGTMATMATSPEPSPFLVIFPAFAAFGLWMAQLLASRRIKAVLFQPLAARHGLDYEPHPVGIFSGLPDLLLPRYSEGAGGRAWDRFEGPLEGRRFTFAEVQKRKMNSNFHGYLLCRDGTARLGDFMLADERLITSFGTERAPDRYEDMLRCESFSSPSGRVIGLWLREGAAKPEGLRGAIEVLLALETHFGGDCRFYNAVNAGDTLFVCLACETDLFRPSGLFTPAHQMAQVIGQAQDDIETVLGAWRKLALV